MKKGLEEVTFAVDTVARILKIANKASAIESIIYLVAQFHSTVRRININDVKWFYRLEISVWEIQKWNVQSKRVLFIVI